MRLDEITPPWWESKAVVAKLKPGRSGGNALRAYVERLGSDPSDFISFIEDRFANMIKLSRRKGLINNSSIYRGIPCF